MRSPVPPPEGGSMSPPTVTQRDVSRRRFLAGAATAAGALAVGGSDQAITAPLLARLERGAFPGAASSGLEHVILVMMENRSFDHFLGWLPGAHGRQAGLPYFDPAGTGHQTYALAPDFQGCGHSDPDRSEEGGRIEYDGGRVDRSLRANDGYSIGYDRQQDLPFRG